MLAIVKYNAGNIFSVQCALKRIGVEGVLTDDVEILSRADKVIFPGVGEASSAMNYLRNKGLDKVICNLTQPVLGICVGLQLMCKHSEEGNVDCLGIFDTDVSRFESINKDMKIPHMGWNTIHTEDTRIFTPQLNEAFVYYVHSYYAGICKDTIATTDYINPFSAALKKDNFYATQFHPEKSGEVGEIILKRFIEL
ncbi:MAG: imidazole glycerol phosphate synthase subunit HisH [Muribaculaceae bacterium]|nr:imidazole glycerol phosphate synthase subunit HisH [Muribaculaceae bacterium]